MSTQTKIEWTQATWNPFLGCCKISPGCKHCYAINHVHRLAGNPNPKIRAANEGLTVIQNGERIGKDAWVVLAAWELTDVEMSVLRSHHPQA